MFLTRYLPKTLMVLETKTRIAGSSDTRSLRLTIPSWMACDSQFPFKAGEEVLLVARKDHIDIYPATTSKKSYQ